MQLKKSTWLLLFLAFSLGSWVYFYEIKKTEKIDRAIALQQQVFNITEAEIQKITITKAENTLTFVRTENNDRPWQMKQPEDVPVNEGTIAFLLDLIATGKSDRSFTVPSSKLARYGLDKSATKISLELSDNSSQEIILGNPNFNDRLVYALVNPPNNPQAKSDSQITVLLVSKNWHYAVERDLSEWKQTP